MPLLAIAAVALALHILYTVWLDPHQGGIGDFYFYHGLANALAAGYGYIDPGSVLSGHVRPTANHPPLWPELLSVVSRIRGDTAPVDLAGTHDYIPHRLVGAFVGTGTVVAIGFLGRRVAGARVGLIAAALAAVYPVLIAADGSLPAESLFGLCVAVSMLLAYRVLNSANPWWTLALGVAMGVTSLARSEGLFLLPLLVLPVVWRRGARVRLVAARVAVAALGVALAIAPWTIRNANTFDRVVIGSTNNGAVVAGASYTGTYHGRNVGLWDIHCLGPPASENEAVAAAHDRSRGFDTPATTRGGCRP